MTDLSLQDMSEFKTLLEQRRDALRVDIQTDAQDSDNKNFANLSAEVRDPGDDSQVIQMSDLSITALEKQQSQLRAVLQALRRIDEGSYGECKDCGGTIPRARLEVNPTAERCTRCQARYENQYRDTTPSL